MLEFAGRLSGVLVSAALGVLLLLGCNARSPEGDLLLHRPPRAATFARAPERVTDGVIAAPGDGWDTELTSLIEAGGGLEWDLGDQRKITHALVSADHDDSYALLVSDDGRAWRQVWEAPPVDAPGQQRRSTASLDANARFVRLEPRGGDGAYSVSELAVASNPRGDLLDALEERRGKRQRDSRKTPLFWPLGIALALAALAFLLPANWLPRRPATASRLVTVLTDRLTWVAAAAIALLVGTALMYTSEYRFRVIDDSYISFQYAKNWASGNGLVFNPGERVEGYTNFLWIACMTPLWWIVGPDHELFTYCVFGLTIALGVAALVLVAAIGKKVFPERALPATLAVLLLAFDDSFVGYAVMGLENHLLMTLMLVGVWLAVSRPKNWEILLGVSFALVAMTRPDGLLWMGTYFLAELLALLPPFRTPEGPPWRSLARTAVAFVLPFGVYYVARFLYYGYPVPNTFYLKVGATFAALARGFEYVSSFVTERYGVPLLALGAVLVFRTAWVRWLWLHAVLHTGYIVYVGGDFYSGHRFLLALIPTLALLVAAVCDRVTFREPARKRKRKQRSSAEWIPAAAVIACVLVRSGTIQNGPYPREVRTWATTVDNNVRYMQWLSGVRREGASFVLGDIGAAGFFADLRVLDVFGVVDPAVAHKQVRGFGTGKAGHEKLATPAELLARKPTYIKWGYIDASAVPQNDYYIFNSFPANLRVEGLWVRDDRERGKPLEHTRFDMSATSLQSWTREGTAFSAPPSSRAARGQNRVTGNRGPFVNSYSPQTGDAATGRLVSPEFLLEGDRLRLHVGGGRDPVRLRVSLIVDGKAVFSETGTNHETLGRREWNIAPLRGQRARMEVIDEATRSWGHILVDEIVQYTGQAPAGPTL